MDFWNKDVRDGLLAQWIYAMFRTTPENKMEPSLPATMKKKG